MRYYKIILVYDRFNDKYVKSFRGIYYMGGYVLASVIYGYQDHKQIHWE